MDFDDFALDSKSINEVKSRKINLDGFASYYNKVEDRFISAVFKIEAEGMDFFTPKFANTYIILLHPHPVMLYNALTVVVVMHIWQGYPPYTIF